MHSQEYSIMKPHDKINESKDIGNTDLILEQPYGDLHHSVL